MVNSTVPRWSQVACISDDPILASVISSYFNSPTEYFPLMAGPRMTMPDWENDVVRKRNACARLGIKTVILAGLSDLAVETFRKHLSGTHVLVINSLDDWDANVSLLVRSVPSGSTRCKPDELMWGLLVAKRRGHKLEVVPDLSSIQSDGYKPQAQHCVMVDDMRDVVPVIAANYAFSVGADVRRLPEIDFDEIDAIYDGIQESGNRKDQARRARATAYVVEQGRRFHSMINTAGLTFITFVTRGVPYGYYLTETPTTHLYSFLDLGRYIADSLYYSASIGDTRLALIVDPGFFADSESPEITDSLRGRGIQVKELHGNSADRRNVQHYIRYYPYDLLYICTHAGELREGRRLTIQFRTRDNRDHILVADVIHTFVPGEPVAEREPMIEVMRFTRFVELDGVAWTDDDGKKRIGAGDILREFTELSEEAWNVLDAQDTDTIRDFPVIEATDGPISLVSEYFAGGGQALPVVFNNACNSLHKLSTWLIIAGARGYLGTITQVEDRVAKAVGREFFARLADETPLPVLLWEVQRDLLSEASQRIYLHFGCHFTAISRSRRDVSGYPRIALARELQGWQEYLAGEHPEKFKQTVRQIVVFIERALREER